MSYLRTALAATVACCLATGPLTACAQDAERSGPLREWLKERKAKKAEAAAPEASASAGTPSPQADPKADPRADPKTTRGAGAAGDQVHTLQHGGLERRYTVHVPKSYDGKTPTPLLLSFHGGGGSMDFQADNERYGQISASEKEGFVVVFPNGYSRLPGGKLATWNAGGCCGPAKDKNIDDVGFARAVVAAVRQQLNIDPQRVFATGFSNGAMLSHRLACEAPDVFRAIAAVSGTDNTASCTPAKPVSVLVIHARNDDHNSFQGGAGEKSVDRGNMAKAISVPETVSRWVTRNACSKTPRRVLEKPGAYCETHDGCSGQAKVSLCVTESGTHSWPGAQKSRSTEKPSQAISANDVMWNFFLGRPLSP